MSLSREKVNHLSQLVVRRLEEMPEVTLRMPSNTVRLQIVGAIQEALRLEEEVDFAVRQTLASYTRRIMEGSREWDVMYQKLYELELDKH
jgi:hypothetical protein